MRDYRILGYTLLEVLVVLQVILTLAVIAAPSWLGFVQKRKASNLNSRILDNLYSATSEATTSKVPHRVVICSNENTTIVSSPYPKNGSPFEFYTYEQTFTHLNIPYPFTGYSPLPESNCSYIQFGSLVGEGFTPHTVCIYQSRSRSNVLYTPGFKTLLGTPGQTDKKNCPVFKPDQPVTP